MGIQINGQTDTVTAIDGSINVGGDVTIPGVLTYEDVTNVDSVGIVTARNGLHVTGGSVGIGTDNPAQKLDVIGGNIRVGKTSNGKYIAENSSGQSKVVIDSSGVSYLNGGNVGIGTDNPDYKLRVDYTGDDDGFVINNTTRGGKFKFATSGSNAENFDVQRYDSVNDTYRRFLLLGPQQFSVHTGVTTSSTERLRIDSDGRLLLGTGTEGQVNADNLTVADSGNCGITIRSGTSNSGNLYFSDATSGTGEFDGAITYDQNDQRMMLYTASTERLRIDSGGHVRINTGDLRVGDNTDSNAGSQTISVGSVSSGSGGIGIFANPTNGNSWVQFGDGTSGSDQYRGYMNYQHGDDSLRFGTAASEKLRITSAGYVNIGGDYTQTSRKVMINGGSNVGQLEVKGTEADIWMNSSGVTGGSVWRILGAYGNNTHRWRVYDSTNSRDCINVYNTGVVTMPQQCGFHVVMHASQTPNNNEMITLWDTDASDSRSYIKNCTFNSGRFQAPVAGLYYFTSQLLLMNVASTDDSIHIAWTKGSNNDTFAYWNTRNDGASANGNYGYGGYLPVIGSTTVYLAANEIFGMRITYTGDIDVYGTDKNWGHWSGFLVA